jgi:hypothetical protein
MSKKIIDYEAINQGPLYVADKYRKPGYHYQFVGDLPGQIEMYQRYGFEIVHDEDIKVGDNHASSGTPIGSPVTVKSKCGQTLYWMAIEDELFEQLQAYRNGQANRQLEAMGRIEGIPQEHQIGDITITKKKFK